MRFFLTSMAVLCLSLSCFADDGGGWQPFADEDDSSSESTFSNPGQLFNGISDWWAPSRPTNRTSGIPIDPNLLARYRRNLRAEYDPHGLVPDRCIVRSETIRIEKLKKGRIKEKTINAGGGGYRYFMWEMKDKGMKRKMLPCPNDFNQVAKKVNIVVDKAGKKRVGDKGRRQSMSVYITYENGDREKWENMPISTGSTHWASSDPTQNSDDFETPSGTFHLNHYGSRDEDGEFRVPDDVETTQAYCVRSKNDSYAAAMPNAVRVKCGVFFHSGRYNGVTGSPASHGCIRMKFDQSRKLYCLMRQRGMGSYGETNHRRTTVHVVDDITKVNSRDLDAAKWDTHVVPRPKNFKATCGKAPLNLNSQGI